MSGMRLTMGIIAQLSNKVGDYNQEEHQALDDYLERIGSSLQLTYGGDMIVYTHEDKRTDDEGPGMALINIPEMMEAFEHELMTAGLFVFQGTPQLFVDHWYDGADPNHLDISLEDAGYMAED